MCGICGKWSRKGVSRLSLEKMLETIHHRGPDDEGLYLGAQIGMGNRRLSVIDLETGKQPISNEDGTIWIVFNGEIYNYPELQKHLSSSGHIFSTRSDTEVIVHLYEEYGINCVKKLRGMFAFALWDELNQRLFLARDQLGQKPLYYMLNQDGLVFASEIKALLQEMNGSPKMNARAMHNYISLRYIPEADTLFEGINKLPAGHCLVYEQEQLNIKSYWDLQYLPKWTEAENDLLEELNRILLETVACHMLSDVPIGAFLSGGLDSTLVAALVSSISEKPIKTFSIGVEDKDFNELPTARMVASRYQTEHYEAFIQPDIVTHLPKMIWHMDEPVDPFALGLYAAAQLASQHVKVVLGGDGGDEIFAGYDRYVGNQLVDLYCFIPSILRHKLIEPIIRKLPDNYSYNNRAQKLRWLVSMSRFNAGERYASSALFLRFNPVHKQSLYTEDLSRQLDETDSLEYLLRFFNSENAKDLVDKMLYTDIKTRLPDHLLMIADRMTMAFGLEGRSPLVDRKVVEFMAMVPAGLKIKRRQLKYLQKQMGKNYLPSELLHKRKQGFSFPLARWFKQELNAFSIDIFKNSRFVSQGFFRMEGINNLLDEHNNKGIDHNYRLWILLNLELWYRLFIDRVTIEDIQEQLKRSFYQSTISTTGWTVAPRPPV
jgi:asparagine synthase (glutamine-hydrolysing)